MPKSLAAVIRQAVSGDSERIAQFVVRSESYDGMSEKVRTLDSLHGRMK